MKMLIMIDTEGYRNSAPAAIRTLIHEAAILVAVAEGDVWRIDKDRFGDTPDHVTPEELAKALNPGD